MMFLLSLLSSVLLMWAVMLRCPHHIWKEYAMQQESLCHTM